MEPFHEDKCLLLGKRMVLRIHFLKPAVPEVPRSLAAMSTELGCARFQAIAPFPPFLIFRTGAMEMSNRQVETH
jgi:hypothetical protein